jgi:hypothetical protein
MRVTYFPSLLNTRDHRHLDLNVILDGIRSPKLDSPIKDLVEKIRKTPEKELRDNLKKQLPVVCFSGLFSERRASALKEYSKLICVDLDELECPEDTRDELKKNEYVYAMWASPTGSGLKVLIRVATDQHLGHALALLKMFPTADENAIKDVNRCCFMSTDPDLYVNPNSSIFQDIVLPKHNDEDKYTALKKWLENKGSKFVNGQRNSFITKLSAAANRFGVDREFLKKRLEEEFLNGSDFSKREMELTVNGIYDRYVQQHNTVSADEVWTDRRVNEVLTVDFKPKDIIYLREVAVDIEHDYDKGVSKGPTTYFPTVDEIWRRVPGQLNVLTGIGNHGKSSWEQQLDLADAVHAGGKFAYFGPEGAPAKRWYRQLIQSLVGKSTDINSYNRMSKVELKRAMEFVDAHFMYIYPAIVPTPEYIIERFIEAIIKHGLKGVRVDPWNQLLHTMVKRDDVYLAEALTTFERFAQQHQVLLTIVTHPNRTTKGEDGNYKAPDIFDLNGGPVWSARASNLYTYHRPNYSTSPADSTCEIIYRKIKDQDLMGVPGTVTLQYDRNKYRFYDNGFNPLDSFRL